MVSPVRKMLIVPLIVYSVVTGLALLYTARPKSSPYFGRHQSQIYQATDLLGLAALVGALFMPFGSLTKAALIPLIALSLYVVADDFHLFSADQPRALRQPTGYLLDGAIIVTLFCLAFMPHRC